MLRAIVVDDERPALNLLAKLLREREGVQVIACYTDPIELLEHVVELAPDVVFLDIEMPEMDGLELASRLLEQEMDTEIVFVTAYRQYAIDAFRVQALDYLLKPAEPRLLDETIERVRKLRQAAALSRPEESEARIVCFGGLELVREAGPIRFVTSKTEELLAYLLVHRGKAISMWALCESLWPNADLEKSKHNLHTTAYRLKKTLREQGIQINISTRRGYYYLECEESCDYIRFEREAARWAGEIEAPPDKLSQTLRLYQGPLFGDRGYVWCEPERERMARVYATLAKQAVRRYEEQGQQAQAHETLLAMLEYVPFDGEANEMLLSRLRDRQDRVAFASHYAKMERLYREELGTELPVSIRELAR